MKVATSVLINELEERTQQFLAEAAQFRQLPFEALNWKATRESWSVLECLEHLNLYGDFYLPVISNSISNSAYAPEATFKSGWLGNYFANSMLPKEKLNRMKTFKDKNPAGSTLNSSTLERFVEQQQKMLGLLEKSTQVSLNKTKTPISITRLVQLRLGDTFRFVIYHNYRHMLQAQRVLQAYKKSGTPAAASIPL